jgi:MFS family permease
VTAEASAQEPEWAAGGQRLAVLLAMAMFVLVVDTSLMNVSIAKVVEDLDTTVSGVQGAIALEALVSAAFILIGSKVGDLIGRKRAFVMGLLGYALGALAMAFAQDLMAIIVFWAIVGGLGASLLLPAMQSLIAVGLVGLGSLARWLVRRKREGKPTLLDPALFKHDLFRLGISSQMLQNIALGGAMIGPSTCRWSTSTTPFRQA